MRRLCTLTVLCALLSDVVVRAVRLLVKYKAPKERGQRKCIRLLSDLRYMGICDLSYARLLGRTFHDTTNSSFFFYFTTRVHEQPAPFGKPGTSIKPPSKALPVLVGPLLFSLCILLFSNIVLP